MTLKKIQPFNLDTTKSYTFAGATLGTVSNVKITGGTSGQVLATDGTGNLTWASAGVGYTAGNQPPGSAKAGDQWYNTSTNILYEYVNDGSSNYWVDLQTPIVSTASTGTMVNGNTSITMQLNGNILFNVNGTSNAMVVSSQVANLSNITTNNLTASNIVSSSATVNGNLSVSISNLKVSGGSTDSVVSTDGNGNLSFSNPYNKMIHPFVFLGM